MKKSGLVIYGLVMLLVGALISGGIAFAYLKSITVGKSVYGMRLEEDWGQISVLGRKFTNVSVSATKASIYFDVVP